jgi:hypothetical protein
MHASLLIPLVFIFFSYLALQKIFPTTEKPVQFHLGVLTTEHIVTHLTQFELPTLVVFSSFIGAQKHPDKI